MALSGMPLTFLGLRPIKAVIQGMSVRDLVIFEGIWSMDRRSISALKVFRKV